MRLVLTAFFIETGFVLMLVPWSEFWDRNYFIQGVPLLHALLANDFVRGAVSGLGVINLCAAIAEMYAFFADRRLDEHNVVSLRHTPAAEE